MQTIQTPVTIDALDLDGATYNRYISESEPSPSPSPRPITTTDLFFPSKIAQFRSEYHLKDRLKDPRTSESVSQNINETIPSFSPNRSLSKVLSDQTFDTIDRTITPARRFSSSDIDQQSIQLFDMQQRQLIEQQKKRRIYNFNHTLFSNIYKRTHRASSTDSHLFVNPLPNRERQTRQRNQSMKEPEITDEHTTSDRVYSRALEKSTIPPINRNTLSIPDENRAIPNSTASRQRLSSSGTTSDSTHIPKLTAETNNRIKKLSFLSARRRMSYYPGGPTNISSDEQEQKRKRDVIWPLKRSYSFDTPFHREAIEALNKGLFSENKNFDFFTSSFTRLYRTGLFFHRAL